MKKAEILMSGINASGDIELEKLELTLYSYWDRLKCWVKCKLYRNRISWKRISRFNVVHIERTLAENQNREYTCQFLDNPQPLKVTDDNKY